MSRVHSFEPVIGLNPRIIILGSMPGVISLQAVQYYANPRNAFWPIMAELFDINLESDYASRIHQIAKCPVILWDTLKTCEREGSLDAKIQEKRIEANDIAGLVIRFPGIRAIAFNGATSEKYFKRLVAPDLTEQSSITLVKLPSTSPANARMTFEHKLDSWRCLLDFL